MDIFFVDGKLREECAFPIAGGLAIIPPYYLMRRKSALQLGKDPSLITFRNSIIPGMRASVSVGGIVGTQMLLQKVVEKEVFTGDNLTSLIGSSALVAAISSPFLAYFNHQTVAGNRPFRFTFRVAGALTVQETAFVGAIAGVDLVEEQVKRRHGENRAIVFSAAFLTGGLGSILGHAANTCVTRWQHNLSTPKGAQYFLGGATKARGTAVFALLYAVGKSVYKDLV